MQITYHPKIDPVEDIFELGDWQPLLETGFYELVDQTTYPVQLREFPATVNDDGETIWHYAVIFFAEDREFIDRDTAVTLWVDSGKYEWDSDEFSVAPWKKLCKSKPINADHPEFWALLQYVATNYCRRLKVYQRIPYRMRMK